MYIVIIQEKPLIQMPFEDVLAITKKINGHVLFVRKYKTPHRAFLGLLRELNKIRTIRNIEPYFCIANVEKGSLNIPVVPHAD